MVCHFDLQCVRRSLPQTGIHCSSETCGWRYGRHIQMYLQSMGKKSHPSPFNTLTHLEKSRKKMNSSLLCTVLCQCELCINRWYCLASGESFCADIIITIPSVHSESFLQITVMAVNLCVTALSEMNQWCQWAEPQMNSSEATVPN